MFCPQCGSHNEDTSIHCTQCGKLLGSDSPPPTAIPTAPPTVLPVQFAPGPVAPAPVPNYMTQAILVTVFCCLPLGIMSIMKAKEVNKRLLANDYAGALEASNSNKTLLWIGCLSGLAITAFYIYANMK